jgi:hypothetical protein
LAEPERVARINLTLSINGDDCRSRRSFKKMVKAMAV